MEGIHFSGCGIKQISSALYEIYKIDQTSAEYSPWAKSGLAPAVVNKVLLEHSCSHLVVCCLWLLSRYNGRVE